MKPTLDIDLVRTFHAVVSAGKFSAAAAHLHKSPASISVHIQRLEDIAGGRLLCRDNQSISLTPLGRRLLASTTALLHAHDRVLSELHGPDLAGRITMGVPDDYAAHVIRDILPVFTATWPNVVLEVKTAPSYTLQALWAREKLQLIIMAQPKSSDAKRADMLVSTRPVWVAAKSGRSEWHDPLPLALYAADCPYREAMIQSLKQHARKWRVVLDSASSQAINACVEAGLGITLIDHAKVTAKMQVLDTLPVIAEHEIVLLRSPSTTGDAAIDLLTQAIRHRFRL